MPDNLYEVAFGSFAFDEGNGIVVEDATPSYKRKVAKADVEGTHGIYLGKAFKGEVSWTITGVVVGTSWEDFEDKVAAFLDACETEDPQTLTITPDLIFTTAHCEGPPGIKRGSDMIAAGRFAVMFTADRD
jgi:hypothetical protein